MGSRTRHMIGTAIVFLLTSHGLSLATPLQLKEPTPASEESPTLNVFAALLHVEKGQRVDPALLTRFDQQNEQQIDDLVPSSEDPLLYLMVPEATTSKKAKITFEPNHLGTLLRAHLGVKVLLIMAQQGDLRPGDTKEVLQGIADGRKSKVLRISNIRNRRTRPRRLPPPAHPHGWSAAVHGD